MRRRIPYRDHRSVYSWMLAVALIAASAACSDDSATSENTSAATTTAQPTTTTAAPASERPCQSGLVLSPGDACILGGSNVFEVELDGSVCLGGAICAGESLTLNQFVANRMEGSDVWFIESVP